MKAALCLVLGIIVTTLALQHPRGHSRRQDVFDQLLTIGTELSKVLPEGRRFNARDMAHFLTTVRRKSSNKQKKRGKIDYLIDGGNTVSNLVDSGLDIYKTVKGQGANGRRRAFQRRQIDTGVNYRKKGRRFDTDSFASAAQVALKAAELFGSRRHHGSTLKRRMLPRSHRRSSKFDWLKSADLVTSGLDLTKSLVDSHFRRASLRRQGGKKDAPAKGAAKADKGGGKAPPKAAPPAEKPGGTEMPGAGGNPSWEDIFKQIVIKVIARRSGHTRRTSSADPYDDLQQRSLHDLLHMLYNLPYYEEPGYSNFNPAPGLTNGRVHIQSVKYTNPPQTADMDIRF